MSNLHLNTKVPVKFLALIAGLSAVPLLVGLTGCAGDRHNESAGHRMGDALTAERNYDPATDQRIEDSRTAERVREALAVRADYRYDGVKVTACTGVVHLSGFVNTNAQRTSAGAITRKVTGVGSVENNLTVKD
jgi:hypothetical protein